MAAPPPHAGLQTSLPLGARPVPIPSGPLRRHALPNAAEIVEAIPRVVSGTVG